MSQTSFYSNATQNTAERFDLVTLPTFQCQDWSEDQVISWLKGISKPLSCCKQQICRGR